MNCPHCGSERIEQGVAWGQSAEAGSVGLRYTAGFLGLVGVAQAYSDLCMDCGAITRTYIKEDTSRKWVKRSGAIGGK